MATMTTISREELQRRIDDVELVEALPPMYFRKAHLPGAVNMPPDRVEELAPKLLPDRDSPVVVYCQDLECAASVRVARRLLELGYTDVAEYAEGKDDWIGAGLPTERGMGAAQSGEGDAERREHDDWKVDEASKESFPASDPPGY